MPASDHVSDKQFFHGTYEELPEGAVIVPGAKRGIQNFPPKGDNTFVHMVDLPYRAADWASDAARKAKKKTIFVYEVEPHTPPVQNEGMPGYQTTEATVKRLHYTGPRKHK
jgi:hypothetical protein